MMMHWNFPSGILKMDRRELFTSFAKPFKDNTKDSNIIRPPYFNNEDDFKNCFSCKDKACITSCEENIIVVCDDKSVKLDFLVSGCTYCDDCAIACQDDVLKLEYKTQIVANIKIDTSKCMSWNQTMCFSCKDPCLDDAINFQGMFKPEINLNQCTMCGFCIKYCPSDAITMTMIKKENNENS
jgi:ferredoxin-type protein NapF